MLRCNEKNGKSRKMLNTNLEMLKHNEKKVKCWKSKNGVRVNVEKVNKKIVIYKENGKMFKKNLKQSQQY